MLKFSDLGGSNSPPRFYLACDKCGAEAIVGQSVLFIEKKSDLVLVLCSSCESDGPSGSSHEMPSKIEVKTNPTSNNNGLQIVIPLFGDTVQSKDYASNCPTKKMKGDKRKTVCFTGITITRRHELKELAEAYDIRVVTSVHKSTDCLVVGPSAGGGKILSACDYGVPILTENEFLELLKEIESRGDHDAAFANLQGYLYSSTEAYEKALSTAPTFKLKDGKQIRAVMVKDFGAGYVIRNSDGKYLTISKGDVSEIRTPSN